jgi:asparagine synthase (glutamine-hydrolysing)
VLLLARDRFGKKPLHYRTAGGTLWFASEPRAILQDPAVPLEPDLRAIDAFLANGYVPHDRSAFAGLRKLPPASTLVWAPGGEPRVERYWEPALGPSIRVPLEEAAERVRDLVLEATRRRLESEVPLGAFLSGGLDSSAVVAAMARVSSAPVRTFSVAFTEGGFDESRHAEEVARRLGTIHERIEVGALDATLLPDLAWHMGEPFADPAALPTFQLAELTSRHVTVALSGDGGDELFSGYDRYRKLATSRRAELVSRPLRPLLARVGGAAPARELSRVARIARRLGSPPPVRYGEAMGFFDDRDRARLYGPAIRPLLLGDGRWEHLVRAWPTSRGSDWRVRAAHLDLESYLPDDLLAKVDLTSMAHSLEVRSPLLDQDLAAYAFRLPPSLNARGGGKQVLRRAVAGWLPDGIAGREKHGFLVPIDAWLRGQLRDGAHEALLDRSARERGLFDPAAVAGVLAAHDSGRDLGRVIWPMLCLEHWFRACVDAPVSREALGVGP